MKVTYIHRRRGPQWFSIERLFRDVRAALPKQVEHDVFECPCESQGLWPRIRNMLQTALHRGGGVNHITGDVHYVALMLPKRRTLLTICDCVSIERLQGIRRKVFVLFWYWLPIRRSALVSVISESTKQEVLPRWVKCPPEKIRVVHCPVSASYTPAPAAYRPECPVILQVGTSKNKNLLRVSSALSGLACHLRIIGPVSAEQAAALKQSKVDYSSVEGISDEQVLQEYRRCDLVLFASTYEGFGLPIVEAQAVGRPVVTSNLLSMPEVANEAACLVDPFDVASIRAGVLRVMQDEAYRNDLIERGFANVQRFRPAAIAAQYVKLYQELQAA